MAVKRGYINFYGIFYIINKASGILARRKDFLYSIPVLFL